MVMKVVVQSELGLGDETADDSSDRIASARGGSRLEVLLYRWHDTAA